MIAVVIPSYKVKRHILQVIEKIDSTVNKIYVVDDCCPEQSGKFVQENCHDGRVMVLFNEKNKGVGGAVISGYLQAIKDNMKIVVKIDGDGQMDPKLLPLFIRPILEGKADYTKGNRFFDIERLSSMPGKRLFGNAVLSFVSKFSSGYWDIMDPTNGYTAAHISVLKRIPWDKVENRYFFESDMLFRLNTVKAVVRDVPMAAKYEDESSGLNITKVLFDFPGKHLNRFLKRIFYVYFLRDFNIGSMELVIGVLLISFGSIFGVYHWYMSIHKGIIATSGTVMLSGLPIILDFQSLLSYIHFDIINVPKKVLHTQLYLEYAEDDIEILNK